MVTVKIEGEVAAATAALQRNLQTATVELGEAAKRLQRDLQTLHTPATATCQPAEPKAA